MSLHLLKFRGNWGAEEKVIFPTWDWKREGNLLAAEFGVAGLGKVFQVLWESLRLLFPEDEIFPDAQRRSAFSAVAVGQCWINLWRRRIYSRRLREGTGGGRWAGVPRLPSQHLPTLGTAGGGGRGTTQGKILTLQPSSVEVSPKLCPTVTHHLEWPGCPQKNNRVGVGKELGRFFPISARSLHIKT